MKMKTIWVMSALLLGAANAQAKMAPIKPACPSQDFKVFLNAYADSNEVQKAFTELPGVDLKKLTFPIIPDAKARKSDNMNLKIEQLTKTSAKVILDKDQTDYRVEFYFQKKDCWQLVKAEDVSG